MTKKMQGVCRRCYMIGTTITGSFMHLFHLCMQAQCPRPPSPHLVFDTVNALPSGQTSDCASSGVRRGQYQISFQLPLHI